MAQIYVVEPVSEKLEKLIEEVKFRDQRVKLSKGDMIDELIAVYKQAKKIK